MKTFLKVITLAATMVSISAVHAADAQKVGVVFPTKVMQESPQRAAIIKTLEAEFKDRITSLQALEKSIRELEVKMKQDGELMSNNELIALQRKIEVKVSEYKFMGKAFEEDQRRRQGEEQQKASETIRAVIETVAKKEGFDLILNGEEAIFVQPSLDISDKVIQEISTK
ncbi:OmpH family outer membrane protein [Psychromonas sp.]|nr:OmpH family outer membrane protein [Psychromonas sp.]